MRHTHFARLPQVQPHLPRCFLQAVLQHPPGLRLPYEAQVHLTLATFTQVPKQNIQHLAKKTGVHEVVLGKSRLHAGLHHCLESTPFRNARNLALYP